MRRSARDAGMARAEARGLHIEQSCPANRWFGSRASNPRAEVRLLPGPSCCSCGIHERSACDVGCMKVRRGVVRPLKAAGDRLSGARTGAHQTHDALPRPPRGRFRKPSHSVWHADLVSASCLTARALTFRPQSERDVDEQVRRPRKWGRSRPALGARRYLGGSSDFGQIQGVRVRESARLTSAPTRSRRGLARARPRGCGRALRGLSLRARGRRPGWP